MAMQQERKRRIQACYPCYTRKQKCNRQYPCNHCSRRRRAEECIYSSPPVDGSARRPAAPVPDARSRIPPQDAQQSRSASTEHDLEGYQPSKNCAIAKAFGYFEDSNTNTMALLRNVDLICEDYKDLLEPPMQSMWDTVQLQLRRMPDRQIFDFLIQYFVSELNCTLYDGCRMKQVIHAPSFLAQYQNWWPKKDNPMAVSDIEFATLIARIGSYATLFLPSPSHNVEQICGRSLSDIRDTCSSIGEQLAKICETLQGKGSLFRVQHVLFAALKQSCEGGTAQFWEGIASACRAAQNAGIHTVPTDTLDSFFSTGDSAQELEREVRRMTFCTLYVLDSHLARQLDRVPFLPDHLVAETLPRLHLISDHGNLRLGSDVDAPDSFKLKENSTYDPTEREHRYERLCAEYLPTLHPAFAIDHPDMTWDMALPKLPMQRQLLYIAIYDSLCWNFRPVLLLKPGYINSLPPYKRVLVQSQKQRLGLAAMKTLEAVTTLHSMFGGSYTRFAVIIFNTFEATVLLLYLCAHADFPFDQGDGDADILGVKFKLTYQRAMQVSRQAVNRLQMLAEMSEMAASGAEVTAQLLIKAVRARQPQSPGTAAPSSPDTSWKTPDQTTMEAIDDIQDQWGFLEQENPAITADMFASILQEDPFSNLQQSSLEIPMAWRGLGI
ncbi:hypothetical protein EMPG_14560 [Blastomyces silverae]|uniref:C6 finger domain transcription factor nscR n=1 Tax=Blastomyces silverae TaxID=2060906 RepID=A0A0H1BFZ4_9EURO|nr:hypothetical protein EMPG_14560 [Blastomyces silverae]